MLRLLREILPQGRLNVVIPAALIFTLAMGIVNLDILLADKGAASPQTVKIRLKSFDLELPERVRAGKVVFEVKNEDSIEHCFAISGQGIDGKLQENVPPGETKLLQMTLAPGNYKVSCPIEDHARRGMVGTLTVVAKKD